MVNEEDRVVTGSETAEAAPVDAPAPAPAEPTVEPVAAATTVETPADIDATAAAAAAVDPEPIPATVPGRVVIVTGAGSGLGFHVAKTLCDAGNDVIVTGKDEEQIKAAVAKIKETKPDAAVTHLQVSNGFWIVLIVLQS